MVLRQTGKAAFSVAMRETGITRAYALRAWDEYTADEIFPRDGDANTAAVSGADRDQLADQGGSSPGQVVGGWLHQPELSQRRGWRNWPDLRRQGRRSHGAAGAPVIDYGDRLRAGVLIPSGNSVAEPEIARDAAGRFLHAGDAPAVAREVPGLN